MVVAAVIFASQVGFGCHAMMDLVCAGVPKVHARDMKPIRVIVLCHVGAKQRRILHRDVRDMASICVYRVVEVVMGVDWVIPFVASLEDFDSPFAEEHSTNDVIGCT